METFTNPLNAATELNIYHTDNNANRRLRILPVANKPLYNKAEDTNETATADIFELKITSNDGATSPTSGVHVPDLYTTIGTKTVKLGTELADIRSDITNLNTTTNNATFKAHIERLEAIITNLTGQIFTDLTAMP